ncbi:Glycosyltransferase involved in cell wall bisynthesis [Prosthecobacter debontii]|uniref:Glycosyltransferase involved in cell wall bisynthesis n=1 Tax=Prosthecobacter debontii TaxID=48467 RepID=A0A1T4YCF6_9BACT|nr:glycosyltransferase [Prosthecobacter debontii]SKA99208.1 Glycosyltransferase involved in cell wall bisynthesis [Prosthecobacter debontii]
MVQLLRLKDEIRHSTFARSLFASALAVRGRLSVDLEERAARLARAFDLAESPILKQRILASLQKKPGIENAPLWDAVVRCNSRYRKVIADDPGLSRSILLKTPSEGGEKGILLMTFEYNWARLLTALSETEFRWLNDRYHLVLSTSWSPTDYAALACAVSRVPGTVYVQSCNYQEIPIIESFHPRLKCLPTLPCDWINPTLYQPLPYEQRSTDIVMVANWGEFKRHWELFQILAQIPGELKVVLIGQKEPGRTQDTIRQLARSFGVNHHIEIHESIPIHEVAAHQCRAKVSVIMSRREGCCVAAVESLFAGCALAMREDAHVGPLAYINDQTGSRLRHGHAAADLQALLQKTPKLRPHVWAQENLACQVSHAKVNALFKSQSELENRPWTRDIIQPQWRPHPTYASPEAKDAVRPAYEELHQFRPDLFPAHLLDRSWK